MGRNCGVCDTHRLLSSGVHSVRRAQTQFESLVLDTRRKSGQVVYDFVERVRGWEAARDASTASDRARAVTSFVEDLNDEVARVYSLPSSEAGKYVAACFLFIFYVRGRGKGEGGIIISP